MIMCECRIFINTFPIPQINITLDNTNKMQVFNNSSYVLVKSGCEVSLGHSVARKNDLYHFVNTAFEMFIPDQYDTSI